MNIYALFPLVAMIAYVPLLINTLSSRPWQRQHKLFAFFIISAFLWSLSSLLWRSDFFLQYNILLGKIVFIMFVFMLVQFHWFVSSFYSPNQRRWLPLACALPVVAIPLIMLNYIHQDIIVSGSKLYPVYSPAIFFIIIPILALFARSVYVFWKRLRVVDNPVSYNQTVSLLLVLLSLAIFSVTPLLPWGREFPIIHFGSIISAFILSYATIRHQLVDIKFVLQRGSTLIILVIIGVASYWLLLAVLDTVLGFKLELTGMFIATSIASVVIILIYKLRIYLSKVMGKAFQGESYDYRQKLTDFAGEIHNVFSLKEQGGELLALVTKAVGCKRAYLLFPEVGTEDFTTQLVEPKSEDNPSHNLRLDGQNPIVEFLKREQEVLTRQSLATLPQFHGLREQDKEEIKSNEIELFMPLISRDRLIGILVLDKKQLGRYSLEDFQILEDVANRVAVSMEKEYLREQLSEREEELSVLNRSSAIITSSLDIEGIYDSFIEEIRKVIDVSWAAIVLIGGNEAYFLALSSEIDSVWQQGERIPLKGTATEYVVTHRKPVVESDLTLESRFSTAENYIKQGVRAIAYLPLIAKGKAIGSLIVASRNPGAYNLRHITLLEQLASQVAMHIENSRLYAEVEEQARIDELTGLLNRRSLDEAIASEISRHSRYGGVFSLIILDIDSLKNVNDSYGHLAGDELLKRIGSAMKTTLRSADQAFRYGGDEFAIVLPNTPIDAANQVAGRIRKQIATKMQASDISVTASLGLASWPADGLNTTDLIAAADAALYQAKRDGGNRSHCASGTLLPLDEVVVGSGDGQDDDALNTIYALAATVSARNDYSSSHWRRVKEYAVALAEALNLEPPEIRKVETCALLHDIGKIGVSENILNKRGKLTAQEWKIIKEHPQVGTNIVSHARQLAPCLPGILHHHERYDGNGYPEGLKGEDIPLEARILGVADAFAAMTADRPYSEALPLEEALEEIRRGAGTQFDPYLVVVFLSIVKNHPVATKTEEKRR